VRFGLDALIGLFPVVGDIITTALSLFPMKSMKYPFVVGRRPSASAFMLSSSSGSNSTLPHDASMPVGKPARCGILVIRGG
jgi:hypothetical protein